MNVKMNFICYSSRKLNFGQISEILGLHFCANMKFRTQPAILGNCLKIIDFSRHTDLNIKPCIYFSSNYYQTASFLISGGHFNLEKTMILGQFASTAMFAKFLAGTRKSLSDF